MVAHTGHPSIWKVGPGGSEVQGQLRLHCKFKDILDYKRIHSKKKWPSISSTWLKKKNTHLCVEEAKKTRSLQSRLVKKTDNWPSTYNEIMIDMIDACRINR